MHQLKGSWGKICWRLDVRKGSVLDSTPVHHCHGSRMLAQVLRARELTRKKNGPLGKALILEKNQ